MADRASRTENQFEIGASMVGVLADPKEVYPTSFMFVIYNYFSFSFLFVLGLFDKRLLLEFKRGSYHGGVNGVLKLTRVIAGEAREGEVVQARGREWREGGWIWNKNNGGG